jgi:hypothetical protein
VSPKAPWRRWLLPFLISFGMATGAWIGSICVVASRVDETGHDGVANSIGYGPILLIVLIACIVVGFSVSMFTAVLTKLLGRPAPGSIGARFMLSIVVGSAVGASGLGGRYVPLGVGELLTWLTYGLLLIAPVLLSWPGSVRIDPSVVFNHDQKS